MPDRETNNIVNERIRILFKLAEENILSHPDRSKRYIELARKIASRNRIHIPKEFKQRICRGCKNLLTPINSHTRIRHAREPHVTITCHNCGKVNRIPLRRRRD